MLQVDGPGLADARLRTMSIRLAAGRLAGWSIIVSLEPIGCQARRCRALPDSASKFCLFSGMSTAYSRCLLDPGDLGWLAAAIMTAAAISPPAAGTSI